MKILIMVFSRGNSDNTNNGFSRAVQTWKTKFFYLNKRLFRVVQINGAVQLSRSVVQWWLSGAIQIIITKNLYKCLFRSRIHYLDVMQIYFKKISLEVV